MSSGSDLREEIWSLISALPVNMDFIWLPMESVMFIALTTVSYTEDGVLQHPPPVFTARTVTTRTVTTNASNKEPMLGDAKSPTTTKEVPVLSATTLTDTSRPLAATASRPASWLRVSLPSLPVPVLQLPFLSQVLLKTTVKWEIVEVALPLPVDTRPATFVLENLLLPLVPVVSTSVPEMRRSQDVSPKISTALIPILASFASLATPEP